MGTTSSPFNGNVTPNKMSLEGIGCSDLLEHLEAAAAQASALQSP